MLAISLVNVGERRLSAKHFIEHYPQAPPVDCLVVPFIPEQKLWSDILTRAAERVGLLHALNAAFSNAEIGQLDMPVTVKNDILGFQISIDNPALMQVVKRDNYLGCIHANFIFSEASLLLEVVEKPTSREVF